MAGIQYKNVIAPVDGSESAERAATFAANLAYCCEGSLTLVFVLPESTADLVGLSGMPLVVSMVSPTQAEIEAAKVQAAQNVFKKARSAMGTVRRAMSRTNISIQEVVLSGEPADALIAYATGKPEAMIVMGSRGMSKVRGLLLGSVSDKVVREAPCPVTIIR